MAFELLRPIEDVRAEARQQVNMIARGRILALIPDWKQSNLIARAVELQSLGLVGNDEWLAIQAAWAVIKQIRYESNVKNFAIDAETNPVAIRAIVTGF